MKLFASPIKSSLLINKCNILQFADLIEKTVESAEDGNKDYFSIPQEFYSMTLDKSQTIFDFCFSEQNEDNDIIMYFREIILKQNVSDETYDNIFSQCDNASYDSIIALAGIGENEFIQTAELFVTDYPDVVKAKRYYLALSPSYDEFKRYLPFCFKNLYFHEATFERIKGFGKLDEQIKEIIRHLTALDSYAKKINGNDFDEVTALRNLKAEYGLECSGKGSNEGAGIYKINYRRNGVEVSLTCNPHTKLYDGHNDYRIYFCWGRAEIENGRIIIASMGSHWK